MILSDFIKSQQIKGESRCNLNPSVPKALAFNHYSIHPPTDFFTE